MAESQRVVALNQTTGTPSEQPRNPTRTKGDEGTIIPRIIPENRRTLYDMALRQMRSHKLGQFHTYRWPMERQQASDYYTLYTVLRPFFSQTDRSRRKFRRDALGLRITTFILFVMYFALLWEVMSSITSGSVAGVLSAAEQTPMVGLAVLAFMAWAIRKVSVAHLEKEASDFGGTFNANLIALRDKSAYAIDLISTDQATEQGCGERAEQWAFIALWISSLSQYYDRYVTSASWRALTGLKWMTFTFRVLKWTVGTMWLIFAFVYMEGFAGQPMAIMASLLFIILTRLFWDTGPFGGASNDLWREHFVNAIAAQEEDDIINNATATKLSKVLGHIRDLHYQSRKVG